VLALAAIINVTSSLGYGLPAIIGLESMGVPSPGETALVLAAVLASQGKLQIGLVILIGVCSAIVGDNIGYLLGRRLGRDVLEAKGPFQEYRLELVELGDQFFSRHGGKAVFLARWIALVRFFWNALGGISWGVTYGLVGYFLGQAAADAISTFGLYALAGLLILFIAYLYYQLRKRRREREARQARRAELSAEREPHPDGDAPAPPEPL
jgi:membrane-associated protein